MRSERTRPRATGHAPSFPAVHQRRFSSERDPTAVGARVVPLQRLFGGSNENGRRVAQSDVPSTLRAVATVTSRVASRATRQIAHIGGCAIGRVTLTFRG